MKQLGNLAIVCATRPEILLQIYGGMVCVHVGEGHDRQHMDAKWEDDAAIEKMIYEINYGRCARKEKMNEGTAKKNCA